ncbi:MAG: formate/nitrite transporter family protein [Aquihabitans sp.]
MEDPLDKAYDRTVEEGTQRLERGWPELLATGTLAGLEVGTGVLALLAVEEATGSPLLAGLAFSIGFLALLLGHSELFTEGFLLPVAAVVARRATLKQLAKLWSGTLVMNLAGGWIITWLMMQAYPSLHATAIKTARHYVDAPLSMQSFALALLAGSTITLLTRMQHGTDSDIARIVAAVAVAFLLAGLQMFHSILDSLLIFAALHTGDAPFGYLDWLRWVSYTLVGNVLGGVLLVTLLRVVRTKDRIEQETGVTG